MTQHYFKVPYPVSDEIKALIVEKTRFRISNDGYWAIVKTSKNGRIPDILAPYYIEDVEEELKKPNWQEQI